MPAPTKVQLTGGVFQDAEGSPLANGYLEMVLSQDGSISGVGQICSGITIKITLDANGSVVSSPAQEVWGNDQISPVNSYYRVTGYTAAGQPAWGPNNQQVNGNGGTFDVGTWIPNVPISWTPPTTAVLLQTDGSNNGTQTKLNLVAGTDITLTDDGSGDVTIAAVVASILLQTDGVDNGSQTKLNLVAGSGISLTDGGSGNVTIAASAGAGSLSMSSATVPSTLNVSTEGTFDWLAAPVATNFTPVYSLGNTHAKDTGGYLAESFAPCINTTGAGSSGAITYSNQSSGPISLSSGADDISANLSSVTTYLGLANNVINGFGGGFKFRAPADTTSRTLKLYCGVFSGTITVTARLSDGSATPVTDTLSATSGNNQWKVWTITYNAASQGKQLLVTVLNTANSTGNTNIVNLAAITLA